MERSGASICLIMRTAPGRDYGAASATCMATPTDRSSTRGAPATSGVDAWADTPVALTALIARQDAATLLPEELERGWLP